MDKWLIDTWEGTGENTERKQGIELFIHIERRHPHELCDFDT